MQLAVLQQDAAQLLIQAAVLQQAAVSLLIQAAALQQAAATAAVTTVAADIAASRCQSCTAQKFDCQSCTAQKFACLSSTWVAAADAVHLADQLANQAAVLQFRLHVLALATDIESAKG